MIKKYSSYTEIWTQRNDLHTRMVEEAAHDRNLFQSSPGTRTVELRFPEYVPPTSATGLGTVVIGIGWADLLRVFDRVFNTGSPLNIPAGHSANLDELIKHYENKNKETLAKNSELMEKNAKMEEVPKRNPK